MKKNGTCFVVKDDFDTETTRTIIKLLGKCYFRKFIKEVRIEKLSGKHRLLFKITWIRGKKPLRYADEIILNSPQAQELILALVKKMCNK